MTKEITARKLNSLGFRKLKGSVNPEYYVFTPLQNKCKQIIISMDNNGAKRCEMVCDTMVECSPLPIKDIQSLMTEVMNSAFKDGRRYQIDKINKAMTVSYKENK